MTAREYRTRFILALAGSPGLISVSGYFLGVSLRNHDAPMSALCALGFAAGIALQQAALYWGRNR